MVAEIDPLGLDADGQLAATQFALQNPSEERAENVAADGPGGPVVITCARHTGQRPAMKEMVADLVTRDLAVMGAKERPAIERPRRPLPSSPAGHRRAAFHFPGRARGSSPSPPRSPYASRLRRPLRIKAQASIS